MRIDWMPPAPRVGAAGAWDRFVGPGATSAEEWVQLGLGAAIAALCLVLFWQDGGFSRGWVLSLVAIVLALDLGGGIVTNATAAAKRWYHRPGHGAQAHLGFVAVHGLHIAAVAATTGAGIGFFALAFGLTMAAAVTIVMVPLYLQRPVAFGLATLGLLASQLPWLAVNGLDWFLPLLWIKLLLAHLVREAPFAPEQGEPKA